MMVQARSGWPVTNLTGGSLHAQRSLLAEVEADAQSATRSLPFWPGRIAASRRSHAGVRGWPLTVLLGGPGPSGRAQRRPCPRSSREPAAYRFFNWSGNVRDAASSFFPLPQANISPPRKPLTAPPMAGYIRWLVGLITTAEAAAILKISPVRVRQYIDSGRLASEKRGRDHLLNQAEVERFNRQGRRPAGRPSKPPNRKTLRVR